MNPARGAGRRDFAMNTMTLGLSVLLVMAAVPAQAALLAHWAFDEGSGTTASDSVGSLDGTLSGMATFVAGGISGNAVSLSEATNDFVTMGNVLSLGTQDFTISAWVKTTSTAQQFPVAKHASNSHNGYMLAINQSAAYGLPGKSFFYVSSAPGNEAISSTTVNDGQWHLLVGVYDAGVNKHIYVDGAPVETSKLAEGMTTNSVAFMVGGLSLLGTPTGLFTGLIDEVRVYDHALDATEVQALFDCPSGDCGGSTTTTMQATTTTLVTTTTAIVTTTTMEEPLCPAEPRSGCGGAANGKGSLKISAKGGSKNKLKWKIAKGSATDAAAFGDPTTGVPEYALCIYDERGGSQPIFTAPIASGSGWNSAGNGFVYKNKAGNAAGITGVKLTPGAIGKTKLQVKAKGPSLSLPSLPMTNDAVAQFVARTTEGTACWTTELDVVKKNTATQFSGKNGAAD